MERLQFDGVFATQETKRKNDEVRRTLRSNGDDGRSPRRVTHFLYPEGPTAALHELIARELESADFIVSASHSSDGIIAEEHQAVSGVTFDNRTEALDQWLRVNNWQYDGWECEVRRAG